MHGRRVLDPTIQLDAHPLRCRGAYIAVEDRPPLDVRHVDTDVIEHGPLQAATTNAVVDGSDGRVARSETLDLRIAEGAIVVWWSWQDSYAAGTFKFSAGPGRPM